MYLRIADLRYREVINVCTGLRIGYVSDVQMDVVNGRIMALVIPGRVRFFGLFGREDDYIIPWENIRKMGSDIILTEIEGEYQREKRTKRPW